MGYYKDKLEPTKKGILADARARYESLNQPRTLNDLLEQVKQDYRRSLETQEITRFKSLYTALLDGGTFTKYMNLYSNKNLDIDEDFSKFVVRTIQDMLATNDWELKLRLFTALAVTLDYVSSGRYMK